VGTLQSRTRVQSLLERAVCSAFAFGTLRATFKVGPMFRKSADGIFGVGNIEEGRNENVQHSAQSSVSGDGHEAGHPCCFPWQLSVSAQ